MFSFYTSLKTYLETNVSLFAPIALNGLVAGNSITIRSMPTAPAAVSYDNSRARDNMFQILTKSKSQKQAMNTLEMIAEVLDNNSFSLTGYKVTSCEVYSEPSHLQTTDQKEYIFTAAFKATIEKER